MKAQGYNTSLFSSYSTLFKAVFDRTTLVLATAVAFLMITAASLVSAELAVSIAGLMAFGMFMFSEKRQRVFWEKAQNFKIRVVEREHDQLAETQHFTLNKLEHLEKRFDKLSTEMETARRSNAIHRAKNEENEALEALTQTLSKIKQNAEPPSALSSASSATVQRSLLKSPHAPKQTTSRSLFSHPPAANTDTPDDLMLPERPSNAPLPEDHELEMEYYDSLSDTVVSAVIATAIEEKTVHVFLQPIVRLPQRQTRYFEMFGRIRVKPGRYIPASRYIDIAKSENQIAAIDRLIMLECLKLLDQTGMDKSGATFFINITSATLRDMDFMQSLLRFVSRHKALAKNIIFELAQDDFLSLKPKTKQVIKALIRIGCSFSLDNVTSLNFSIPTLKEMNVRFMKFDAPRLMQLTKNEHGVTALWKLKRALEENDIAFVIEKVEDEHTLTELLDFDVHYGQGYHLGKPDLQGAYIKAIQRSTSSPRRASA